MSNRKHKIVEEWRTLPGHPKYEISRTGTIRNMISKKIRNEPNQGFRYYRGGVRKSTPIRILLEEAFAEY